MTWLLITSVVIRVTLILAAAAVLSVLLRRSSAAMRHLLWTVAIAASLVTPLLSAMLPHVSVGLLPVAVEQPVRQAIAPASAPTAAAPGVIPLPSREQITVRRSAASASRSAPATQGDVASTRVRYSAMSIALIVYVAGMLVVLLRLVFGTARMTWVARRARPVSGRAWGALAERLRASLGICTPVTFLEGEGNAMPVAWGIFRHRVLLPSGATEWPIDRQRVVLLHELAHVKRRDCLTQLAAQIACAVYWFNPLAWVASRRLRTEREHACDDLVLAFGTRGSEYAEHLLDIARSLRGSAPPTWAAVAMAHRSQLEGRLMAILETTARRTLTRRAAVSLAVAFALVTLAVALVTPFARTTLAASSPSDPAQSAPAVARHQALPTPTPIPSPTPAPLAVPLHVVNSVSEAIPHAIDRTLADVIVPDTEGHVKGGVKGGVNRGINGGIKGGVTGGVNAGVAAGIAGGVRGGVHDGVRGERRTSADPKIVAALVEALKDSDDEVRKTALMTLAQFGAKEAVEPLRAATKDADAEIRQQAVFALGQMDDPANYEYFVNALNDQNASVAEQGAFALGGLGDKRAVGPLANSLKSSRSADVRKQSAFALGQIGDPSAVDALIPALHDESADVRQQAAFALGRIGDARASDALMGALKDPNPQVRRQAAFALSQVMK